MNLIRRTNLYIQPHGRTYCTEDFIYIVNKFQIFLLSVIYSFFFSSLIQFWSFLCKLQCKDFINFHFSALFFLFHVLYSALYISCLLLICSSFLFSCTLQCSLYFLSSTYLLSFSFFMYFTVLSILIFFIFYFSALLFFLHVLYSALHISYLLLICSSLLFSCTLQCSLYFLSSTYLLSFSIFLYFTGLSVFLIYQGLNAALLTSLFFYLSSLHWSPFLSFSYLPSFTHCTWRAGENPI
jgi:hypothetical protein